MNNKFIKKFVVKKKNSLSFIRKMPFKIKMKYLKLVRMAYKEKDGKQPVLAGMWLK